VEYNPALDDAAFTTATACDALLAGALANKASWLGVLPAYAEARAFSLSE
jgi:hypothetical protein